MDILSYLMGQNSAIKKGMKVEVVTELPETGTPNVIYLVPKQDTGDNDIFEEYLYVDDDWELIGTTDIDLSGYQTTIQYSTMPTASADTVGKIVQYTGATSSSYTNGYFYKGTSTTENNDTIYSWSAVDVQAHQSLSGKQDTLVSGTNIKTINNESILGNGNINISSGSGLAVGRLDDKIAIYYVEGNGVTGIQNTINNRLTDFTADYIAGRRLMMYIEDTSASSSNNEVDGTYLERTRYTTWDGKIIIELYNARPILGTSLGSTTSSHLTMTMYQIKFEYNSSTQVISNLTVTNPSQENYNVFYFKYLSTDRQNNNTYYNPTYKSQPTSKGYVDDRQINLAPAYSTSSTYSVGDYVTYDGVLYVCNTTISTAEAWTAAHWTQTNISSVLGNINTALDALTTVSGGA